MTLIGERIQKSSINNSNNMELTGKVIAVLPTQSGTGRSGEWIKNSFVIEWQDNGYTQHLCLEVMGHDKWEKMKQNIAVGNLVTARFSVSSREFQNRWFTTASCFYCVASGVRQEQDSNQAQQPQQQSYDSSLPF